MCPELIDRPIAPTDSKTTGNLVTFALFAYNQEEFIRDAILGAFAQTYEPLEIILSDDCSSDRTFEVMQEMAANYAGPHRILLNRNEKNLNVCEHVNHVSAIASGSWLVAAAGDDISLPHRVETIMNAVKRFPRAGYCLSYAKCFTGKLPASDSELPVRTHPVGATEAFSCRLFQEFGPLQKTTFSEDWPLYFRAQLLGDVIRCREPLVYYRYSDQSVSGTLYRSSFKRQLEVHQSNMRQFFHDVTVYSAAQALSNAPELKSQLQCRIAAVDTMLMRINGDASLFTTIKTLCRQTEVKPKVRLALIALVSVPSLALVFERFSRTRLGAASPWAIAFKFLDTFSLLAELKDVS